VPDTPLQPHELDTYKTDVQTEAESPDLDIPTAGQDARPWVALGIVLLGLFVVTLIAAIAFGFFSSAG